MRRHVLEVWAVVAFVVALLAMLGDAFEGGAPAPAARPPLAAEPMAGPPDAGAAPVAAAALPAEDQDDFAPRPASQLGRLTMLRLEDRTRDNGVWYARLALGEVDSALTTGRPTDDHVAILQTVENLRRARSDSQERTWTMLEAMQLAAPHITGAREGRTTKRRQLWLRTLPAHGREAPAEGWRDCSTHPEPCGDWEGLYGANWVTFRTWAIQQVIHGYEPTCEGEPIAYGCYREPDRCFDDPRALRRGLCVLPCDGAVRFWAKDGNGCELGDERTVAVRERAAAWCAEHPEREVCDGGF